MINRVAIVCSGNICRSPLAMVVLDSLLPNVEVVSAGVSVEHNSLIGQPAVTNSREIALTNGFDLSNHSAKQLTKKIIDECDLILVMNYEHIDLVAEIGEGSRAKTLLFGQWIGVGCIEDPIGKDMKFFQNCFSIIVQAAKSWEKRLG